MAFVPAPQLTVTIERQADRDELHVHPGSQGVWQTRMMLSLGVEVTVCACLGGEVGRVLEPLLSAEGVKVRIVHRDGGTGWYVHDRRQGKRKPIAEEAGLPLSRHDVDELYSLSLAEGLKAAVSVLSGPADPSVVPPEMYRRLAADLGNNGSRVVADLSGEHLKAVLAAGVSFLKVSHEEVLADGLAAEDSDEALVGALRKLHGEGAETIVISRADRPALALLDGRPYEVRMPKLEVTDPRGAGDSMTAGVAAVLARGGDIEEAVCTGAAAGALNVTRHGLGSGRAEAVHELINRVALEPIGA